MPEKFNIGDIVQPKPDSGFVLHSGASAYSDAVCVSVKPFVLVSRETDMLWNTTVSPKDFMVVERADKKLLHDCLERHYHDHPKARPKSITTPMEF